MRIFIGIKLDKTVQDKIEKFMKPFKKISSPLKWVKPGDIHITLKFIGDVSDEKYSQIENSLTSTTFNTGPFNLALAGCGKFGKRNDLNILWTGITPNNQLEQMYNKIEDTLEKFGIEKETRKFKPHITVARNKKPFNFKSLLKIIEEKENLPTAELTVNHFQVFKSQSTPNGPIYTILKEIPLVTT